MDKIFDAVIVAVTTFLLTEVLKNSNSPIYYQRILGKFGVNNSNQPFLKLSLLGLTWIYIGACLISIPLCLHTIFFEMDFGDLSHWNVALLFLCAVIPLLIWIKRYFIKTIHEL